jgi:hypothetical protein
MASYNTPRVKPEGLTHAATVGRWALGAGRFRGFGIQRSGQKVRIFHLGDLDGQESTFVLPHPASAALFARDCDVSDLAQRQSARSGIECMAGHKMGTRDPFLLPTSRREERARERRGRRGRQTDRHASREMYICTYIAWL